MDLLLSQLQNAVTLYAEILACIFAASILGWLVGLMMQRSRHRKRMAETVQAWENRYRQLENTARTDSEALEEQLQSLARELKSVQATNRALTDTLKKNDSNIQQSRAEAIELNRQHTETHERLQRIIQQKDREIAELGNRLNQSARIQRTRDTAPVASKVSALNPVAAPEISEGDLNNADTIAIPPSQLFGEAMDATVQMTVPPVSASNNTGSASPTEQALDQSFDDTSDLSGTGIEESTVVMDEDALAFARRSYKRGRGD